MDSSLFSLSPRRVSFSSRSSSSFTRRLCFSSWACSHFQH